MSQVHYRRIWRRLTAIITTANLCGAGLLVFYFTNIYGGVTQSPIAGAGLELGVTILITVGLLALGNWLSGRRLDVMWVWYRRAVAEAHPEPAPLHIQRLALNMPAISAGTTLTMWAVASLIIAVLNGFDPATRRWLWNAFGQILLGGMISAPVTAVLIYFALDRAWRSELPLFFRGGDLTQISAFRLRIRSRMLILFVVGTIPLLLLAVLSYGQVTQMVQAAQPALLLPRLLRLTVLLGISGLLTAVVLAQTMSASVIEPLETLSQSMTAVGEGNLDVRMAVTSNDEIGVVSARFNDMTTNLKRRHVELQTVYQISQDITGSLELEQTLQTILERVRQMVAYDGAEICLYDEMTASLRVQAWAGSEHIRVDTRDQVYRLGEGFTGWIGENKQSLLIPDVDQHLGQKPVTRQVADGIAVNGYLGVPLLVGPKLVGTLEVVTVATDALDVHAQQLLETVAPQAAIAIHNARQVLERERRLKEQIEQLRIEVDEVKRARQVEEVTETDYFRDLQEKARQIRSASRSAASKKADNSVS
ncbi:MAG: GAF domain-containing protein [Anaerolineae bacterium]|nr:GAF domain-containing protein [Anaerolineae bacterium]